MLLRPGPIPRGEGWAFELKYDGFRAIVSTEGDLRVRSRRGWNMTTHVPELRELSAGLVLDGELVALNESGAPHWPLVCERVLHGNRAVRVTFVAFDLLRVTATTCAATRGPTAARCSKSCGRSARARGSRTCSTMATRCSPRLSSTVLRDRRQATQRRLPARVSGLDEDQKPWILAAPPGTRIDAAVPGTVPGGLSRNGRHRGEGLA